MAEHLYFPDSPLKPLRIEYDGPQYDGGDWNDFPTRYGWRNETGTMELFYQHRFPPEKHEKQYLTTAKLHQYVEDVKEWERNKRSERSFTIVEKVCQEISRYDKILRDDMKLAIRLICHALWNISVKRDGSKQKSVHVQKWFLSQEYEAGLLLQSGWCLWETTKSRYTGGSVDTIAYLLQLTRKKPAWDKKTHDACKKTECVANNINENEYVTRHVTEECNCGHLHAVVEELHRVLNDGGVPLISITPPSGQSEDEGFKLEVVRKRVGRQYVAISHVWSDGLGNANGNSLPQCQIQLLYERARSLVTGKEYVPHYSGGPYAQIHTSATRLVHFISNQARGKDESVLVWIDTLCIPHQRDVRSLAIQRIREVYLDAYRTMILDSEMRQVESDSTPLVQLLLRVVYCSGWIRRLWTLQEGLAAKSRLYVLFSDKAINISTIADELLTKHDKDKLPVLQENLTFFAMSVWFSFFKNTIDYASKFEKFVEVVTSPFMGRAITEDGLLATNWYNVAMRAATKPGDRPIILAGVLNLDVKPILDVKGGPEERMRAFYGMLAEFPPGILFMAEPRFEDDGMRWAVKACQYAGEPMFLGSGTAKITPRGLQVSTLPSWLFSSEVALDLSIEGAHEEHQAWVRWLAEHKLEDVTEPNLCYLKLENSFNLEPDKRYGLILQEPTERFTRVLWACALVEFQSVEGDDVHYTRHVAVGHVRRVTSWDNLPHVGYLLPFSWASLQKRVWVVG
ncbi:hypothetical protein ZTR_10009 [Talaromyces verruculosus]|nr:hypothetical protein ZTR_10009 [Talaromyces verruculosus]